MKQEHEMTPGVLVSGEVLSAGDARARVAVLEAELAELRKRVCVPEGYLVVPIEPTEGMRRAGFVAVERADGCYNHDESDECPHCGDGFGKPDGCGSRAVIGYRAMLSAAPAPFERVEVIPRPVIDWAETGALDYRDSWSTRINGHTVGLHSDEERARNHAWALEAYLGMHKIIAAHQHPAPIAAQDVAGLPFVRKILEKLERFRECAEDDEGVDIGRHWLDILTRLGLLNRVQRSPARWEMTAQADDALETAHQQREGV